MNSQTHQPRHFLITILRGFQKYINAQIYLVIDKTNDFWFGNEVKITLLFENQR